MWRKEELNAKKPHKIMEEIFLGDVGSGFNI